MRNKGYFIVVPHCEWCGMEERKYDREWLCAYSPDERHLSINIEKENKMEIKQLEIVSMPEVKVFTGNIARQGDVFMRTTEAAEMPELQACREFVIVRGEGGNTHTVVGDIEVARAEERVFAKINGEGVLSHPEHGDTILPEGTYVFWQQRQSVQGAARVVGD